MSGKRRRFGAVRKLPSGRYQARYLAGDGRMHHAPTTFATSDEAEQFLAVAEADVLRGQWFDAESGKIRLDAYAPRWIVERPVELQPRTLEIYDGLLRNHICPTFGGAALGDITSPAVRTWHASLRTNGVGTVTVAKAYRLLKAIMATAVDDDLIAKNPCRLRNAGVERSPERKPPSITEVDRIAAMIEPRYRVLVLLAAWTGLRWGELGALTRQRIDQMHGIIHVEESLSSSVVASGSSVHRNPRPAVARLRCHRIFGPRSKRTSLPMLIRRRLPWCSRKRPVSRWTGPTCMSSGDGRLVRPKCRTITSTTCVISARRWRRSAAQRPVS